MLAMPSAESIQTLSRSIAKLSAQIGLSLLLLHQSSGALRGICVDNRDVQFDN
jgi:hypothetical protein